MESPHQELQGQINSLANYGLERFSDKEILDELSARKREKRIDEIVESEGGYDEDPFKAMHQGMIAAMKVALEDGIIDQFVNAKNK